MDIALRRLIRRIPPPPDPRFSHVAWERLQEAVGLTYPKSFREFIDVYGGCVWFDNVSPFFAEAQTDADVKRFLRSVQDNLKALKGNMYDHEFRKADMPLYPDAGGLFPFLVDYSSDIFFWITDGRDSNKWPVAIWQKGPIFIREKTTIAKMILDFLDRDPFMIRIWGDINQYELERRGLTETSEPAEVKKMKRKKKEK